MNPSGPGKFVTAGADMLGSERFSGVGYLSGGALAGGGLNSGDTGLVVGGQLFVVTHCEIWRSGPVGGS